MMENILLPCPFCGSTAKIITKEGQSDYDYKKTYYDIGCKNDDCYLGEGSDWNYEDLDELIRMWNKRENK